MARTGTKRENGEDAPPTICDPLGHPMRTRILDVLNEEPMSPVRFLDDGFSPITFNKRANGLSYIAYHFRALEKAGCIELVERVPGAARPNTSTEASTGFTSQTLNLNRCPSRSVRRSADPRFRGSSPELTVQSDRAASTSGPIGT